MDTDRNDDVLFYLRDPEYLYEPEQVMELLEEAQSLGFSLERGSELENMTVRELERLVRVRQ